ncbi:MAG: hypothetical protein JXB03_06865 [Spirochaetales bacterium]|nr:hypothetical protein [Spirochaetales bacterium]
MKPLVTAENVGEYLFYHPVSFELTLLAGTSKIKEITLQASIAKDQCTTWLKALHESSRHGIFDSTASVDELMMTPEDVPTVRVLGTCVLADGKRICFDTDSHIVEVYDSNRQIIEKRVLPEPFPQRYKMLYDQLKMERP